MHAFHLSKEQLRKDANVKARDKPAFIPIPAIPLITDIRAKENLLAVLE
jgi:hypothetical protein